MAIFNAREYEREHRVSSVFQAAALPLALPVVDGVRFDAFYQAGRQEALVGGDWFDAVVLADGRVLVSVGDVCGSGLQAAVQMSNVRQVMRAVAHVDADPLRLLDVADRALRDEYPNTIVTAFVGIVDPARQTFHYASAGHPPALLRPRVGDIVELTTTGLPLGLRSLAPCASGTHAFLPGSSLLLYTDGLIEWSHDILAGEALLRERFAELFDANAEHPAAALVNGIFRGRLARDDVAALAVTFDRSPAP
jgi:serine phosphatase RsbU (regulator of sigma subunit)